MLLLFLGFEGELLVDDTLYEGTLGLLFGLLQGLGGRSDWAGVLCFVGALWRALEKLGRVVWVG